MTLICPGCRRAIPLDDVNVANDIALCRACGLTHSFADLAAEGRAGVAVDLSRPPPGAWRRELGSTTVIGATNRSLGIALGALGFGVFWNGIVSVFVLLATRLTLDLLKVPLPDWVPMKNVQQTAGPGAGFAVFLWLFLTPFLAIGAGMMATAVNAVCGRTELTVAPGQVVLFRGVGPLGWRRRFTLREVASIRLGVPRTGNRNTSTQEQIQVALRDGRTIHFGAGLRPDRRVFLAAGLRRLLG